MRKQGTAYGAHAHHFPPSDFLQGTTRTCRPQYRTGEYQAQAFWPCWPWIPAHATRCESVTDQIDTGVPVLFWR